MDSLRTDHISANMVSADIMRVCVAGRRSQKFTLTSQLNHNVPSCYAPTEGQARPRSWPRARVCPRSLRPPVGRRRGEGGRWLAWLARRGPRAEGEEEEAGGPHDEASARRVGRALLQRGDDGLPCVRGPRRAGTTSTCPHPLLHLLYCHSTFYPYSWCFFS